MTDHALLLPQAIDVVREAGQMLMRYWHAPREIHHKGRIDLVTTADLALEKLLKERLSDLLPEAAFLAEESASAEDLRKSLNGPTWIIDPLDGTTNFAHGFPFVAISVALWDDSDVQLGLVHLPVLQELFHAAKGQGTHLNDVPVQVSKILDLENSLVATGFPYSVREQLPPILGWMETMLSLTQGIRRPGSAASDLAYVACGRFDAFYEINLKPWDMAAGWLLVREAGGMVTQIDGSEFHPRIPSLLASNAQIHAAMVEALGRTDN
ncbi:inositol monophosphatase family protein [Desulfonatronum thioautotrophicum]|uniref:inositol monophosphatase family protein n=1 Tax=Desulfonatronum thioautotrophicum TaxID=617001 RepID=UPI0005EAF76B|nr:inositol monophosphatase family protein [Desulfonatronum thioautotrophicum]